MHRTKLLPFIALAFLVSACSISNPLAGFGQPKTIAQALKNCEDRMTGNFTTDDNKKTLGITANLTTKEKPSIAEITCVLNTIGAPETLIQEITSTDTLTETRTTVFDGYELAWKYHPSFGHIIVLKMLDTNTP